MGRFEHIRHLPPKELDRPHGLILVLAPTRSNVNLSRIVRLAGCAGLKKIIQCGTGSVDRRIARDALEVVEIEQRRSMAPVVRQLKDEGYACVGLEQTTNSTRLFDFPFQHNTALIVGNEREGLDQSTLDLLDSVVEIPVYGRPHSYNIATATTMAVYEYLRQFTQ